MVAVSDWTREQRIAVEAKCLDMVKGVGEQTGEEHWQIGDVALHYRRPMTTGEMLRLPTARRLTDEEKVKAWRNRARAEASGLFSDRPFQTTTRTAETREEPMTQEAFEERAERLGEAFRARYGVSDVWSDEQIERALADHDLPGLDRLPPEPRGMMVDLAEPVDLDDSPRAQRAWQRTNAMHLLAHCMLHGGERCGGCEDWGASP